MPDADLTCSNNTLAGSSLGSWGTSFPSNACLRMLCRSRMARIRLASICRSATVMSDNFSSTSMTNCCCSASGASGIQTTRTSSRFRVLRATSWAACVNRERIPDSRRLNSTKRESTESINGITATASSRVSPSKIERCNGCSANCSNDG